MSASRHASVRDRRRVVVLGGNGNFGARICRALALDEQLEIVIAGRDMARSATVCRNLMRDLPGAAISAAELDYSASDLASRLAGLEPSVVVHSAGPFQRQDYRVAEACLECGSHYVDLADGRDFVVEFDRLDEAARQKRVLLVAGASTLPGISSAVVRHLSPRFSTMSAIEISIVPANRTPRGASTIQAVLGYCGRPFAWLENGHWKTVFGWQSLVRNRYPSLGSRWTGACDVPDLDLFPKYYPTLRTVTFRAGLELLSQQLVLWSMAWIARMRLVSDWSRYTSLFKRLSDLFESWGTDRGGMHVRVTGTDDDGATQALTWYLFADSNHGPEIPCVPAIILARKLAKGEPDRYGAMPCVGLITLDEFAREVADLDITWEIVAGSMR